MQDCNLDDIIETVRFEVFKYEVYYSYYDECKVIIPKDGWGFIINDIHCKGHESVESLLDQYHSYYIFTNNGSYDPPDIYLSNEYDIDTIKEYMDEYDTYCTLYPGDIVRWNSGLYISRLQSTITIPDINKIEEGIIDVIYDIIDLNDNTETSDLFPNGYIDSYDMSIYSRNPTLDDIPTKEVLFPIYLYYSYQHPNMALIHANDHKHDARDRTCKQYVRCKYLPCGEIVYMYTASVFVSIPERLCDIHITY